MVRSRKAFHSPAYGREPIVTQLVRKAGSATLNCFPIIGRVECPRLPSAGGMATLQTDMRPLALIVLTERVRTSPTPGKRFANRLTDESRCDPLGACHGYSYILRVFGGLHETASRHQLH